MDPEATKAALVRHCRLAKRTGYALFAFNVVIAIGVIGDVWKDWYWLANVGLLACVMWGWFAMHRAKRLFDALVAESFPVREHLPGCLCIPGAMLDHPQCPHHGDSEAARHTESQKP